MLQVCVVLAVGVLVLTIDRYRTRRTLAEIDCGVAALGEGKHVPLSQTIAAALVLVN